VTLRHVIMKLRAQHSRAIVNVSSLGGQVSFAGAGAYSASKFALEGMSETSAQELMPLDIKMMIRGRRISDKLQCTAIHAGDGGVQRHHHQHVSDTESSIGTD
jgi:NAD(P)-dependent dehydrogenase (short-subunit alcohol dehydrogenase family)